MPTRTVQHIAAGSPLRLHHCDCAAYQSDVRSKRQPTVPAALSDAARLSSSLSLDVWKWSLDGMKWRAPGVSRLRLLYLLHKDRISYLLTAQNTLMKTLNEPSPYESCPPLTPNLAPSTYKDLVLVYDMQRLS